jgi:antitoxin ChpS
MYEQLKIAMDARTANMLYFYITREEGAMHKTNLRKVGGSVMLSVPPSILELLDLQAGNTVGITIDRGRLVIEPQPRPRYTLTELLAASDYSKAQPAEEREWVDAPAVGREII